MFGGRNTPLGSATPWNQSTASLPGAARHSQQQQSMIPEETDNANYTNNTNDNKKAKDLVEILEQNTAKIQSEFERELEGIRQRMQSISHLAHKQIQVYTTTAENYTREVDMSIGEGRQLIEQCESLRQEFQQVSQIHARVYSFLHIIYYLTL